MRRPARTIGFVLLGLLPVLAVALADLPLVPVAEASLEHRARTSAKAASVEAQIGGFPVMARALLIGEVAAIDVTWFGVEIGEVQATAFYLHLDGVGFDRSDLIDGTVRIKGVEAGHIRLLISPMEMSRLFDREVRVDGDDLKVTLTPTTEVAGEISATSRGLVLTAPGAEPVTADLGSDRIPCAPKVEFEGGNLVLECDFRGLPALLRT